MLRSIVRWTLAITCTVAAVSGISQTQSDVADYWRGKQLHDSACIACHDSDMYTRPERAHNPYWGVRQEVERWQAFVGLGWTEQDIADVTQYVQATFYDQ